MAEVVHVQSFAEYWQAVKRIAPMQGEDEMLFFRGVSNASYGWLTGIQVNALQPHAKGEDDFYHSLLLEYPEDFDRKDHLEVLAKMQHYGLPTRLLDMSTNILTAAFFAVEQNQSVSGKVDVFRVKKRDVLHHNSDRARMLACLPPLRSEVKAQITDFCRTHPGKITDQQIVGHPEMEKLLHEIRGEFPAFETAIIGEDLLRSFFVQAQLSNPRMRVQSGFFLITGLDAAEQERYLRHCHVATLKIAAGAKKEFLKDLEWMHVKTDTIYPDLERTALYIRSKKLRWGDLGD